ncbi:FadR/GntR family transcriptional regulator [Caldimonas tepidiphila]|uniref:FadR/GntR family transcriptional regulator n=1 Tax=Caldimonas tepidiphila TaxID=2315841 RepID=UPI000E5A1666|nr:FadR/GntR family transcriptional regulator [Caldimonas tepidiphila]
MNTQIHPPVPGAGGSPRLVTDRLSDRLAARLRQQIESGELSPGDRLPTEPQLAEAHGVSRTVVREAVHQLRSQGLLLSKQGAGVFVAQAAVHKPLTFDATVLDSFEAVLQVVELRRVLEGEIAALAAERATRAQVEMLRGKLDAIDAAVDAGRDGVAEDLAFHRAIGDVTGNPQFARLLEHLEQYLREAMRVTRGNEARYAAFMEAVRSEHHAIVDAIAAGDAEAARRCATGHIASGQQRLRLGGVYESPPLAVAPPEARPPARGGRAKKK